MTKNLSTNTNKGANTRPSFVAKIALVIALLALILSSKTSFFSEQIPALELPVKNSTNNLNKSEPTTDKVASQIQSINSVPPITNSQTAELEALYQRIEILEERQKEYLDKQQYENKDKLIASQSSHTQYVEFRPLSSTASNILVQQADDGSIFASNNNPTLTGKTVVFDALRADGTIEKMTIAIPPPE